MGNKPQGQEFLTEAATGGEPIQYVDITAPPKVGGAGGLGYTLEQTLSRGGGGVDVRASSVGQVTQGLRSPRASRYRKRRSDKTKQHFLLDCVKRQF